MNYSPERINKIMLQKNLTPTDIQNITGLKRNTIYAISSGKSKNPTMQSLKLMAKALDVTLDYLISDDNQLDIKMNKNQVSFFVKVTTIVAQTIMEKDLKISLNGIQKLIHEVYEYSSKTKTSKIDKNFIFYLLECNKYE